MQNLDAKTYTKRNDETATRVPVPMTHTENLTLEKLAESEQRSKSAMARIIYRLGLAAYKELQQGKRPRKT